MILAIDFDGTIVDDRRAYTDVSSPLRFIAGAKSGLQSLKRAGHTIIVYSARANLSLREDPDLDPLFRKGKRRFSRATWQESQALNQARYDQMVSFVYAELEDVVDAIDDGRQGKVSADLYFDDKARGVAGSTAQGMSWSTIADIYGEPGGDPETEE